MALWGKKEEELPPELKGKTPEQVAAAIVAAEQSVGKVASLETQLASRETEFGKLQQQLATVTQTLQDLDAWTKHKDEPTTKKEVRWDEDAEGAFKDRFGESVRPLVNQTLQNTAILAKLGDENIINSDPMDKAILIKYRAEVDDWYNRTRPTDRAQSGTYLNCFRIVAGNHTKEIIGLASDPGFLSPSGGAPSSLEETAKKDVMTEQQHLVAQRLGITDEQYSEQAKKARSGPLSPVIH